MQERREDSKEVKVGKVPCHQIKDQCGIKGIVKFTLTRRREWISQINRLDSDGLHKIAKDGKLTTKRPPVNY